MKNNKQTNKQQKKTTHFPLLLHVWIEPRSETKLWRPSFTKKNMLIIIFIVCDLLTIDLLIILLFSCEPRRLSSRCRPTMRDESILVVARVFFRLQKTIEAVVV